MKIENVLSNDELQKRFDKLCEENWLIKKMAKAQKFETAKESIDGWVNATRLQLMEKLNIQENEDYKFIYHQKV